MKTQIFYNNVWYNINLAEPIELALPLHSQLPQVKAFYAPDFLIEPVIMGSFVGDTLQGGAVNFKNVQLNPHGNGTHTECVGHISTGGEVLPLCLKQFFFLAVVLYIKPTHTHNNDYVILKNEVEVALKPYLGAMPKAVVIATMPNNVEQKKTCNYSGTNPPYLHHEAAKYLADEHIEHLLIDLPSVDREQDEGLLLAHKAFWQYPHSTRYNATITELIVVPNEIPQGLYFLQFQICNLYLDASPSKPVLYKIKEA